MITEMAKKECKYMLSDLLKVIDEKEMQNFVSILKLTRENFKFGDNQDVVRYINDVTFDMLLKRDQCRHAETMKSINDGLAVIEDFIAAAIPAQYPEKLKRNNSTSIYGAVKTNAMPVKKNPVLKVLTGGKA